jgi:hypothetical protein
MASDVEVQDAPAIMTDDDEAVQLSFIKTSYTRNINDLAVWSK